MGELNSARIQIGVSSCLLGEEVRYNGGHKRSRYITDTLSDYFQYVPLCPELAVGLGVPRPPIRLVGSLDAPRAISPDDPTIDATEALDAYGREIGRTHTFISGFILKAKSPSCGMERVKVYDKNGVPSPNGRGLFAKALMETQPLLPCEEEGRLNDPGLRGSFLERVFAFHHWQCLIADGLTPRALVAFHTEHKFLLMAHDQETMRALGRLVAQAGSGDLETIGNDYIRGMMQAMTKPARLKAQVNVLQHLAGFLSDKLDSGDRQELDQTIHAYRREELPIIAPLTLIRHHLRRLPLDYLEQQKYLEARPAPLDPRR
jgi:uncharacterized protein YbgA (DUF1722 family)/uncharacterized protein YbbK (DUF523 family)